MISCVSLNSVLQMKLNMIMNKVTCVTCFAKLLFLYYGLHVQFSFFYTVIFIRNDNVTYTQYTIPQEVVLVIIKTKVLLCGDLV